MRMVNGYIQKLKGGENVKKRLVKKILKNPERYTKAQIASAMSHQKEHNEKGNNHICFYCEKYHLRSFVCDEHKSAMDEELYMDIQAERRMERRHRVLPSGDVEYADEYGGY